MIFGPGRPVEVMENFRELYLPAWMRIRPRGLPAGSGRLLAKSLGQSADRVWREIAASGNQSATTAQLVCVNRSAILQKAAQCDWSLLGVLRIMPSCFRLTKSLAFKPWNERKAGCECPMGVPSRVSPMNISAMALRRFLPPSTSPPAKSMPAIIGENAPMNSLISWINWLSVCIPYKELHVVLDNLSSHLVEKEEWSSNTLRFISITLPPMPHGSIRSRFGSVSLLSRRCAEPVFSSVKQLIAAMDAFIKAYNQTAAPFQWTKVRVSQKSFASKYSNLIN